MCNSINHGTHGSLGPFVSKKSFAILFQRQQVFGHAVVVWALYVEYSSPADMHVLESYSQF